jgi:hypothetical protein
MRSYILTDNERKLLTRYLMTGETPDAFWVLLHRINKSIAIIEADLELVRKTLVKYTE